MIWCPAEKCQLISFFPPHWHHFENSHKTRLKFTKTYSVLCTPEISRLNWTRPWTKFGTSKYVLVISGPYNYLNTLIYFIKKLSKIVSGQNGIKFTQMEIFIRFGKLVKGHKGHYETFFYITGCPRAKWVFKFGSERKKYTN